MCAFGQTRIIWSIWSLYSDRQLLQRRLKPGSYDICLFTYNITNKISKQLNIQIAGICNCGLVGFAASREGLSYILCVLWKEVPITLSHSIEEL